MNRIPPQTILCCFLVAIATGAFAADKVHLLDGSVKTGSLTSIEGDSLQLQEDTDYGKVVLPIPLKVVDRVEFDETATIAAFLKNTERLNVEDLTKVWTQQHSFLPVRGSIAAEVGLAAARKLDASGNEVNRKNAGKILSRIQEHAWNPAHAAEAFVLDLQILIVSDAVEDARERAEAALAGDDRDLRIAASFVLARSLIAEYKAFLKENPRWEIDPAVRPERHRIYGRIFDLLLVPYLEYGLPAEAAARSLWEMVQLYDFERDTPQAVGVAKDIVTIYPGTGIRKLAEEYITKHPIDE